jgi:hypothetical protein
MMGMLWPELGGVPCLAETLVEQRRVGVMVWMDEIEGWRLWERVGEVAMSGNEGVEGVVGVLTGEHCSYILLGSILKSSMLGFGLQSPKIACMLAKLERSVLRQ